MNRAWYITLEYAKRAVKIEDTLDDETYRMAIQAASDAMPVPFFVQTRTIEVAAPHPHHILLRELGLLSVTTLEVRRGNTWQTLSPADYTLEPAEAPYLMPPRPYWKISRAPSSRVWFSERDWAGYSHGYDYRGPNVRITGKWGTYDLRRQLPATLSGLVAADTGPGTITLSIADGAETGHTLHIDDEDMFVTAVANADCTVDRGVNGTTPASHAGGSTIEVYTYPSADQACLLLVQRYARRSKDAPFGIVGSIDGFMRLAINDPDVLGLIGKFMQQAVA